MRWYDNGRSLYLSVGMHSFFPFLAQTQPHAEQSLKSLFPCTAFQNADYPSDNQEVGRSKSEGEIAVAIH